MKLKSYKILALFILGLAFTVSSCFKDLDTVPLDKDSVTSATVYDSPDSYKQVLAKLYAGLSVSGQQGPAGDADIDGIDEGFSTYIRQYWKAQELSTDEAVIAWNDGNIHDFHQQDWDSQNEFITAMYNRIYFQIVLCNEFIRETTDEKLSERGVDDGTKADVAIYRAEARFLRALSYWHALDMFRNVPFVTEEDNVGAFFPEQIQKEALFDWIEAEVKAIEGLLLAPGQNEYARADQAAAWTLLAKLYLNGKVYTGKEYNTECVEYCNKVISSGYNLESNYARLFMADNHLADGIIFPATFDGTNTRTWGGMTFLVHAAVGGSMSPTEFGIDGGWGGIRTTSALPAKFSAGSTGTLVIEANPGNTYDIINVPGEYQSWNPEDDSTVLASVNGDGNYEGYKYLVADQGFKFADGGWDTNWGDTGADGTLEPGGDNLSVAEDGMYKINLDLNSLTYTIEKTDWGLIGDATPGGWDNDTDMIWDAEEKVLKLKVDLANGKFKFRANDGWDLNYGDNEPTDVLLEGGGSDIAVPEAGTYIVRLYLDNPDYTYSLEFLSVDGRGMFHTDGQNLEIEDISLFTDGYAISKYTNINQDGSTGSDLTFVDTDFPLFRLADVYLMYAEAVVRGGGGGDLGTAVGYLNALRERAYNGTSGNITEADVDLPFLLDERARELYWEGHRRTDLIRFGKFSTTDYLWPWKGGVPEGKSVSDVFDVFPIPASDIGANPNLVQNSGY